MMATPGEGDTKTRAKKVEEMFRTMGIAAVNPITTANADPGSFGELAQVQTNAFGVIVGKNSTIYMYDLKIYAELVPGKTVEFTKKGKDDCLVNDRKTKCANIITVLMEHNQDFFKDKYKNYYDGQSLFFSLFDLLNGQKEKFRQFTIPGTELAGDLNTLPIVIVELKQAARSSFEFGPQIIAERTAHADLTRNDRLLTQFMEVVFNQYAIMNPQRHKVFEYGKTFMTNPLREGFTEADIPNVGDGKNLMVGTQKAIRQIEGPLGRGANNPAMLIDAKKAAFHLEQNCADKVIQILGRDANLNQELPPVSVDLVQGVMKGLFVETLHLKNKKKLQISKISKNTATNTRFETSDGRQQTVAEYFAQKYNIQLKLPNAPLLVCLERGKNNCYPLELCKVIPFQRVTIPQQTPNQSKLSTKECAVAPTIRQMGIMKGATALELLNQENPYVVNAGLKMCQQPLLTAGRLLKGTNVQYENRNASTEGGKWRTMGTKYIMPAECEVWAAYFLQDNKRLSLDDFRSFVQVFYNECLKKGMRLRAPAEIKIMANEQQLHDHLKMAAEHKCKYALIVASDQMHAVHKYMKLWERELLIITQHVKESNMVNIMVKKKMLTMENIINKTNCKLGGLNYSLDLRGLNGHAQKWFSPQRLFLGIALSHPPPTAAFEKNDDVPTIVGFAGNMKANMFEFLGDFTFQDSRETDIIGSIPIIIGQAVKYHEMSHDGKAATEILIYRGGVDEGSYAEVITREVPLIRSQLKQMGVDAKIAIVVATKEHNMRLFRDQIDPRRPPPDQNIVPGIVVDKVATHPAYKEFYLNSHITLQGSARTPRYTVLVDDLSMSMDEIEGITFALAHDHQIVSLTTSLPTPLYIAQRYAERGRMVYGEFREKEGSISSSSSGNWDDVCKKLSYYGTPLGNARVNA